MIPQSFSPLPRERAVLQGEGLAKSAEIGRTLAHFGTPAEAAIEHSQSHGALAFMATEHGTGSRRGIFLVRDPTTEPRTAGSETRAEQGAEIRRPSVVQTAGSETRAERWTGGGISMRSLSISK